MYSERGGVYMCIEKGLVNSCVQLKGWCIHVYKERAGVFMGPVKWLVYSCVQ